MAIRPIEKEGPADVTPASASGPTLDSPRSPSPEAQARETEHVGREARIEAITDRILFLNRFFEEGAEGKPKYRVLELIGRGGMGAVFKAEQRTPIKRLVAIKLVKPGYDTKEVIARFESEKQALARMDHGSVAKVLDAGADDMGRPYFVMEYVPGAAITDFADQNKLPIRKRLELFVDVCEAVSHAHSKAIIHRDIKSSNVLAYFSSGKPVVKVIDFGIAKALTGDRLTDATMNTRHGQLLGTYESMSPEQAEGSPDIDTRTDVYSLGALLYELLTGAAPFDRAMFSKAPDQEIRRIIREVEPPRPSTRVTSLGGDEGTKVATARQEPLAELAAELRTELEWIPLMAMRKSRDRRYATPLELADDVKRYLEHRPLRAGPESKWYVAKKTLRRHRFAIGAAAAVVASLVVGLVVSMLAMGWAWRAEAETARELKATEIAMAFGGDYATEAGDLISARRLHTYTLDELRKRKKVSAAVLAGLNEIDSSDRGQIPLLGVFGDGGIPAFRGHTRHPNSIAVLPRYRAITAGKDGQLYLWSVLTGRMLSKNSSENDKTLNYVAVSKDGTFAATAGSGGGVGIWDVDTLTLKEILAKPNKKPLWMVAISPDGERIVAGTQDGELWLWEKKYGWKERQVWKANESGAAIAFPPHESRFVVAGDGTGDVNLCDLDEGKSVWSVPEKDRHTGHVNCVAFSGDGKKVVTAGFDGRVVMWDVQGRGKDMRLVRRSEWFDSTSRVRQWRASFSPDGARVVACGDDGVVTICDVTTGEKLRQFKAQRGAVMGAEYLNNNLLVSTGDDTLTPDGTSLASALKLWDLSDRGSVVPEADKGNAKQISVDDAGDVQILTKSDKTVKAGFCSNGLVRSAGNNSDDVLNAVKDEYREALRHATWANGGSRLSDLLQNAAAWRELGAAGNGRIRFFTNKRNELELRGLAEDTESSFVHMRTLRGHDAPVVAAGMSPNGRFVVSIDEHGRCLGWDLLRPVTCREFETKLTDYAGAQDTLQSEQKLEILKNWYIFRGRGDLSTSVQ